jgi:hypothetical protein
MQYSVGNDERRVKNEPTTLEGAEQDQRACCEIAEEGRSRATTDRLRLPTECVQEVIAEDERICVLKITGICARAHVVRLVEKFRTGCYRCSDRRYIRFGLPLTPKEEIIRLRPTVASSEILTRNSQELPLVKSPIPPLAARPLGAVFATRMNELHDTSLEVSHNRQVCPIRRTTAVEAG